MEEFTPRSSPSVHHSAFGRFPGCSKRSSNEAAGRTDPGAYTVRYVRSPDDRERSWGPFSATGGLVGFGLGRAMLVGDLIFLEQLGHFLGDPVPVVGH